MKLARESAEKRNNSNIEVIGDWPFFCGVPMVKISCAAAELVPTQQYGNCTIGPVQLTFFASAEGEVMFDQKGIAAAISRGQSACEAAVAEDRQTVQILARARAGK